MLGSQWGDEGKGKLSDVLANQFDLVARFNGGANAGHTVVDPAGRKVAFHLLPCGLMHEHTTNLLGNGVVVDFDAIAEEGADLDKVGIEWRSRLKISNRAHILFRFHKLVDGWTEQQRGANSIGTTKKGIGPCYTSKAFRNGVRVGMLVEEWSLFEKSYRALAESMARQYPDVPFDFETELAQFRGIRDTYGAMVVDGVHLINEAHRAGKRILVEGANAAMLDLDFGTYPYVTSSSTTSGGIATGLGLSPDKIDSRLGVVKAYTTRVGWGPFPTELTSTDDGGYLTPGAPGTEIGHHLQTVGAEIGVTTRRKRRCGWLDVPVLQYSMLLNNYSALNITKLDVMDELETIKICTAYKLNGRTLQPGEMPSTLEGLAAVEPVYEEMSGWKTSIANCRTWEELPKEAQQYLNRIEQLVNAPITWIGVGVGRLDMVYR